MDKKKITSFIIVAIFLAVVFFLVSHSAQSLNVKNIKYVNIAGQSIRVDLALTKETQTQGLSGRGVLKDNEGMLFVFNHPGEYRFWMKDMNFPIDIVWMNENRNVVYVEKNARPENFPETYGPHANTKYVLEVVSGFSDKNNLKIGDRAEFVY